MAPKKIPFVDLKPQHSLIAEEVNSVIQSVISDRAFIMGKYVSDFENNFAAYCHARHCIGVGNGTEALVIALKALGIGSGDEVIVPANSFIATSEAVTCTGARVVFVDCDAATYNIDVNKIAAKISSHTKAIIAVHLYGQPADLASIGKLAQKFSLKIIQDCAQAHGASIGGKPIADFGDILCFSFYPGKNLGAFGDAGAVVTNDDSLAQRAMMIANHGRVQKYNHEFEGMNSRMDGIQGAVLDVKLRYLPQWNKERIRNAGIYSDLLKDITNVDLPHCIAESTHVYHLYVIRSKKRDELKSFLEQAGISTGIHYPIALPNLKAYAYLEHKPEDFPIAGQFQNEILSLPMYPGLSEEGIEYVVHKIDGFFRA